MHATVLLTAYVMPDPNGAAVVGGPQRGEGGGLAKGVVLSQQWLVAGGPQEGQGGWGGGGRSGI